MKSESSQHTNRYLSKNWFYREISGAIKVLRILMVCFPAGGQLYCFCCRRFVPGVNENFSSFVTRFDKWSKLHPNIHDHDTLADHLNYLEKWKTMAVTLQSDGTADTEKIKLLTKEKTMERSLYCLLSITFFLSKQNIPWSLRRCLFF